MKDCNEKGDKKKQHDSSPEDVMKQPAAERRKGMARRRTKAETNNTNSETKILNKQYSQPKPKRLTKECIENICSILPLYNNLHMLKSKEINL